MRQDDGWRWLRNSSGIVAAVCGLIALPVVTLAAVVGLLVPFTLRGCEYSRSIGPEDLGMSVDEAGAVTARVPSCHRGGAQVLRLLGPDQVLLWQAEAAEPQELRDFVVGVAPQGFADTVPMALLVDPELTYDLQLLPTVPAESEASATTTSVPAELATGARALFRPADLEADQIYFNAETVAADEFDSAACGERRN